ncbi:MAG TPA: thiamine pyrophosphate-binding protein [Lentisphaeria bacterium]|nr:MAG: hypothetical protein A2X47_01840 [Lentisphaerae bacterium GWF2_38_69]HBM15674.1 thiamine pyrophosphate-binding protein [Lentisphaeria bacterium]
MKNVAEYIIDRLADLGITECFGVPGDFAFPLNRAVANHKKMRWVGCSNELNAAYAADGYAREKGASLLCTTYAVGELSALNGVMGAKAEYVPVFHLVGMPSSGHQIRHNVVHHTLGDGSYLNFAALSGSAACVTAVLNPSNVVYEMERVIANVKARSQPAYLLVPMDMASAPVTQQPIDPYSDPKSDSSELQKAVKKISEVFKKNQNVVIMPSFKIARFKLQNEFKTFLEKTGCSYVTMLMDKAVISEDHPQFAGMYFGDHSNPKVKELLDSADWILNIGASFFSDINTFGHDFTWDENKIITIDINHVKIENEIFCPVRIKDVITELINTIPANINSYKSPKREKIILKGEPDAQINMESLYCRYANFIRQDDIVVVEVGSQGGIALFPFPKNATYYNQTLWGSIGFATPCSFGTALASPNRRTLLFTGEGSHQMTANELGNFSRYEAKVIIFVLNNDGYMIERALEESPDGIYNDLAPWNYTQLPAALGCKDWYVAKVTTNAQLDIAMKNAENHNDSSYIEIITDKLDFPKGLKLLNSRLKELYR